MKDKRSRLIAVALALGVFAALPFPNSSQAVSWNLMLLFLWAGTAVLAWSHYFRPDWSSLVWFVDFGLSLVAFFVWGLLLPAMLIGLWGAWVYLRERSQKPSVIFMVLGLSFGSLCSGLAFAQASNAEPVRDQKGVKTYPLPGSENRMPATASGKSEGEAESQPKVEQQSGEQQNTGPEAESNSEDEPAMAESEAGANAESESDAAGADEAGAEPEGESEKAASGETESEPEDETDTGAESETTAPDAPAQVKAQSKTQTQSTLEQSKPQQAEPTSVKNASAPQAAPPQESPAAEAVAEAEEPAKNSNEKIRKQIEDRRQQSIREYKQLRAKLKSELPKPKEEKPKNVVSSEAEVLSVVPKYLTGYEIKDIVSCANIDRIPWKFKRDQRKTRLLLKDELRYHNHTRFHSWEVYQVMDRNGFITYIFRRPVAAGKYESLVVKDLVFNRIVDTAKGPKTVESHSLKTLINRNAITFYGKEGSTLSYAPGAIGNSVVTIQQAQGSGRLLPPVFLRGNVCDRPDDDVDQDSVSEEIINNRGAAGPRPPSSLK